MRTFRGRPLHKSRNPCTNRALGGVRGPFDALHTDRTNVDMSGAIYLRAGFVALCAAAAASFWLAPLAYPRPPPVPTQRGTATTCELSGAMSADESAADEEDDDLGPHLVAAFQASTLYVHHHHTCLPSASRVGTHEEVFRVAIMHFDDDVHLSLSVELVHHGLPLLLL